MGMTIDFRNELKEHCKRKLVQFERVKDIHAVTPNDWKLYEEHLYVLGMIEKIEKIEQIYSDYLDDMDAEKLADKLGEVL